VDALGRGDAAERPRLGVGLAPAGVARRMRRAVGLPERDGALIREVEADGAADRAGLAAGDLIVAAGGTAIRDADDLADAIAAAAASGTLELTVVRGTDERQVSVTLAA
jgi:serine protease Do